MAPVLGSNPAIVNPGRLSAKLMSCRTLPQFSSVQNAPAIGQAEECIEVQEAVGDELARIGTVHEIEDDFCIRDADLEAGVECQGRRQESAIAIRVDLEDDLAAGLRMAPRTVSEPPGPAPAFTVPPVTETSPVMEPLPPKTPCWMTMFDGSSTPPFRSVVVPPASWVNVPPAPTTCIVTPLIVRFPCW
jgi:hypothetical protein